jgi:polyphosphate kinase 2 (PPK2 family)
MLETVDLNAQVSKAEYTRSLARLQVRLHELAFALYQRQRLLIAVYEGWDAAGKGGNIRRVTEKLDPRGFVVHPIAAPAGDDRTHHYLWRFWRRLPPPEEKQVVIFDRSWYGRVLVERVEGFCTPEEWKRAYREINDFERQLTDARILLVKFWIHISKEEQLRRFEERQGTPHKQWKLTDEDWRNRDKWDQYEEAVEEMLLRTSTKAAPWTVAPGNHKWVARLRCLERLVQVTEEAVG